MNRKTISWPSISAPAVDLPAPSALSALSGAAKPTCRENVNRAGRAFASLGSSPATFPTVLLPSPWPPLPSGPAMLSLAPPAPAALFPRTPLETEVPYQGELQGMKGSAQAESARHGLYPPLDPLGDRPGEGRKLHLMSIPEPPTSAQLSN